ncbi:MAG: XdhC family protein [Ktedonobacterales bacterium]
MREVVADIARWRAEGKRVALATVVSMVGSAPRGLGATLAASDAGEISGSVSGGCVEPAVIEEGMRALRTGKPKLLSFGITEEQNLEQIGLSCGGEIRVFVQALQDADWQPLAQALHAAQPVVWATVINGSADHMGTTATWVDAGASSHSVPSALGPAADGIAAGLLQHGESGIQTLPATSPDATSGQPEEVFFSVLPPQPTLIIVGAGHAAIPLTRIAKVVGYKVIVVDAREAFATPERLPDVDELLVEWPDEALAHLPLTGATAIAVLTHDEKFDVPALKVALNSPAGYIGAIGSRGTRERRDRRLREIGVTDEQIARIHGPIGLSIGAKTPEEIAVAILAEIIASRRIG